MPKMTVTDENGQTIRDFDAIPGISLMENLRNNDFEDVVAICGGLAACATCQIYLDPSSYEKVGDPGDIEAEMMHGSGVRKQTSRLSCQIDVTDEIGSLTFSLAPIV